MTHPKPDNAPQSQADLDLSEAIKRIYAKYGPDLGAFFRDVQNSLTKPDNAPTPTGPVLSALETGWLGEILSKNKEFMDEVPESLGGTGVVIKELRGLLAQRDKRVEGLQRKARALDLLLENPAHRRLASTALELSESGNVWLNISAAIDAAMKEPPK